MKISANERLKIKAKLIAAAVDEIIEKGFKSATMRAIARRGGVSDATIYNYFPTKEKIIAAYFEQQQHKAIETLKNIPDFHTYSLQEQLHTLIESKFELFLPDREFVAIAFERVMQTPVASKSEMADGRALFTSCIEDMLSAAIEAGEIPEQPYQGMIPELFTDLYLGMLYYWLKDESDHFTQTTQLLDKSLDFSVSLLQSGVVAKGIDIISFLFRQHMNSFFKLLDPLTTVVKDIKTKRNFMDKKDV